MLKPSCVSHDRFNNELPIDRYGGRDLLRLNVSLLRCASGKVFNENFGYANNTEVSLKTNTQRVILSEVELEQVRG